MREVPLGNSTDVALVDDEDYETVMAYRWTKTPEGYVIHRRKGQRAVWMHRLLLNAPDGQEVDHANCDPLDNTRRNIRFCTRTQNCANRMIKKLGTNPLRPYRGVKWRKRYKRWAAVITVVGKRIELGRYKTPHEAAMAYDNAARLHYGDFARLNFPNENERGALAA